MPQVFVIHSQADHAAVLRIRNALKAADIDTWIDSLDCEGGRDDWPRQNLEVLRICQVGLYIYSSNSSEPLEYRNYAQTILDSQKPLYVATVEQVSVEELPQASETVRYFDLTHSFESEMARLITALRRHAPRPRPTMELDIQLSNITGSFPRWQKNLRLIGRDGELNATMKSLSDGQRVTAILGPSGVGKTRLAVEAVLQSNFKHGIIWHTLSHNSSVGDLTTLVRNRLRLDPQMDSDSVWAMLGRHEVLLVLDDAEECRQRGNYAEMINMLDLDCGTRILMTTRQRWGELHDVKAIEVKAPASEIGIAIMREILRRETPAFPIDGYERPIAEAAHFRPKLMRYAVRWADAFPPHHVLAIVRSLREPETEQAYDDLVMRTIRLIETDEHWPEVRSALQRLAVTSGSFTFDAARALIKEGRSVQLLKEWGLLSLENSRYVIDPLVLINIVPDETARPAHFDHYLNEARRLDADQNYTTMEVEYGNFKAAFDWAVTVGHFEDALQMAKACGDFMAHRGHLDDRKTWLEWLAAKVSNSLSQGEPPNNRLQAEILMLLGVAYMERLTGDRKTSLYRAVTAFDKAARYFTPQRDAFAYAQIQNNMGITYRTLAEMKDPAANLQMALGCFDRALKIYTPNAHPLEFGAVVNNLGGVYLSLAGIENRRENLWQALTTFRRALTVLNADKAPIFYGLVQNNLGATYTDLADLEGVAKRKDYLDKAVEAFRRACRFLTEQRSPMQHARTMANLGHTHRNLAETYREPDSLHRAIGAYTRAISIWTSESAPMQFAAIQHTLGMVYLDLGEMENTTAHYPRAIEAFRQALTIYSPRHNLREYVTAQTLLGVTYKRQGNDQAAVSCWQDAEHHFRNMGENDIADRISRWISGHSDPSRSRNVSKLMNQTRY